MWEWLKVNDEGITLHLKIGAGQKKVIIAGLNHSVSSTFFIFSIIHLGTLSTYVLNSLDYNSLQIGSCLMTP